MTSKHSTGGGHIRSLGRAGGLGEPERRSGEREQNPPDDSTRQGAAPQAAGQQEQAVARGNTGADRQGGDASAQRREDSGQGSDGSQPG